MHRLVGRGLVSLVLMTAIVLISGCSGDTTSDMFGDTPATPTTTLAPLSEDLLFQGDISGILITGVDHLPMTHDNPIRITHSSQMALCSIQLHNGRNVPTLVQWQAEATLQLS